MTLIVGCQVQVAARRASPGYTITAEWMSVLKICTQMGSNARSATFVAEGGGPCMEEMLQVFFPPAFGFHVALVKKNLE